jgi:hypothetical protein
LNKGGGEFRIGVMAGFVRVKSRLMLAVCVVTAVSGAFLSNVTESIRSFEFEAAGAGTWTTTVTNIDYLAVVPKIGRSSVKVFSPLRTGSLRLFVLPVTAHVLTTHSKPRIAGKIKSYPDNIKNTILVKLRI